MPDALNRGAQDASMKLIEDDEEVVRRTSIWSVLPSPSLASLGGVAA
jgi:hypothetical protein